MSKKTFTKIQKTPIFVFCEGLTEVQLFRFLKDHFDQKIYVFRQIIDLGGLRDLAEAKKKYRKETTKISHKFDKRIAYLFLFIIDGDLVDSLRIKSFLSSKGCSVEQFPVNTEHSLLSLVGKNISQDVPLTDYRSKCKRKFKEHFSCDADKLDEANFKMLFPTIDVVSRVMPVVSNLLRPSQIIIID